MLGKQACTKSKILKSIAFHLKVVSAFYKITRNLYSHSISEPLIGHLGYVLGL